MLAEFYHWWVRQIADLAAPIMHRLCPADAPDAVLLAPEPAGIMVLRRRKGRLTVIGTLDNDAGPDALRRLLPPRDGAPMVLSLPGPFLVREATLPDAAHGRLDRLLRYEMDRLTPFTADAVLSSHRILARDRRRGTLLVEIVLAPRARVEPILERLGVSVVALEAPGPDGATRRIALRQAASARESRLSRAAVAACLVLAILLAAVPVARQSLALADATDRIAALAPRMAEFDALRRQIASGSAIAERIAGARAAAAEKLAVLGLLTDMLPDDTWLTSVSLRQHRLELNGHSGAAARLLAAMGAEPRLRNPAFASPVLRDAGGGEMFSIQTDSVP